MATTKNQDHPMEAAGFQFTPGIGWHTNVTRKKGPWQRDDMGIQPAFIVTPRVHGKPKRRRMRIRIRP